MAKRNRWDSDSDSDADGSARRRAQEKRARAEKGEKKGARASFSKARLSSVRDESERVFKEATPVGSRNAPERAKTQKQLTATLPQQHNFYLHGCRSVDNYARIGKIDEGTYGVVSKARDKVTGDIVALKQVKMSADMCHEGFPVTALRETNVLLALDHPNIVKVREMVVGSTPDKIFMVMDYAENDLKNVMENKMKQPFLQSEVKNLMHALLSAIAYMHERWYIHRDLKTSNLLYDNQGVLKVCDFGLARKYGSPIRGYTQLVVTLWYRAPELLLGATTYSTAVDMWSVGCIFAEILLMKPLFPGRGEIDQMDQIFKLLGSPTEENWPGLLDYPNTQGIRWKWQKQSKLREKFPVAAAFSGGGCALSNAGFDLLRRMLTYDPKQRISAKEALAHDYFKEAPAPKRQEMMPTFPA
uniref:Cyclin-dependent kinase 2 homolog n=1 Tax=Globisporangium ultimum (strain ATCC 200006 / CBS 805.95 / DAOM BR144) TaxID=431595 RepID=K3WGI5_GLOUD